MPNDNKQIKDGLGNLFTVRMHDVSPNGDGSLMRSMMLDSLYPIDYGQGGMYQHCAKSGVIAAGIANNSPIYSFYWSAPSPSIPVALINRIRLNAWSVVAFTSGNVTFDVYRFTNMVTPDTGGTQANLYLANYLRTGMASSEATIMYSNTGALTVGTRTLDAAPLDSQTVVAPQTVNTPFTGTRMTLFEKVQGEHPLFLVQNEGFVVQVTVPSPGVGTWQFAVTTEWNEISNY